MSLFSLVLGTEGGSVINLHTDYCHLVFASQSCRLSLGRISQHQRHSKQVQLHSLMGGSSTAIQTEGSQQRVPGESRVSALQDL